MVMEVIWVVAQRGAGTQQNPDRTVQYYYSKCGKLLAVNDPINGPVDHFELLPNTILGAAGQHTAGGTE
jgi:hypothetical protein